MLVTSTLLLSQGVVVNNKTTQSSEENKRSRCEEESTKFDALGEKNDIERMTLFQRLICALIEEDESEESYHQSEAKNIGMSYATSTERINIVIPASVKTFADGTISVSDTLSSIESQLASS